MLSKHLNNLYYSSIKMARYLVVSDFHRISPDDAISAIKYVLEKDNEFDAIILNGDIVGDQYYGIFGAKNDKPSYFAKLLEFFGGLKQEVYIVPGSHETVKDLESVLNAYEGKYENLFYTIREPVVNKKDHDLIFLAGSDFRSDDAIYNGYHLQKFEFPSNYYHVENGGIMYITNLYDLEKYIMHVKDPITTLLFSHIPRKFSNPYVAVDFTEFGLITQDFKIGNKRFSKGEVFPSTIAYVFKKNGIPIEIRRENRGNEELQEIFEEVGIKKQISGHFHESVHRAHDHLQIPVKEGTWTNSLYFMASYVDAYRMGIVEIESSNIRYYRVILKKGLN